MARISITVDTDKIRELAKAIEDAGGDLSVPIERALIQTLRSTDLNFRQQGRPTRWIPQRSRPGGRTLEDTGRLRASVTRKGAPDNIFRATGKFGEVGTRTVYAATHQFGRGPIPARPFLVIQEQDEADIQEIFEDYLREELNV